MGAGNLDGKNRRQVRTSTPQKGQEVVAVFQGVLGKQREESRKRKKMIQKRTSGSIGENKEIA